MKASIITGTLAALSLAGLLAAPALADSATSTSSTQPAAQTEPRRDRAGCPDGFDAGDKAGVRICHARDGAWRLETTDPARSGAHEYTGVLTTDGNFVDVRLIRPESDDSASIDGEGKLKFDFKTFSGIDGIEFHVADQAKEVTFNLMLDGQQLPPAQVFLGDKGRHPKSDPFKLHTHRHHSRPAASPTTTTTTQS